MNILEIVEIRDKLKAELAVVEKFLEIAKKHEANGSSSQAIPVGQIQPDKKDAYQRPLDLPGGANDYGAISATVSEAIRLAADHYTIRDLSAVLEKVNKPLTRNQISTVLNRFERRGIVQIHRRGKGSKPTVFKKTHAPQ